jgi:RNA polymerase-binding transcription factor DksA
VSETADPSAAHPASGTDAEAPAEPAPDERGAVDLDAIEHDLAGVEGALQRLDDGTYWTDEVTGAAIRDEILVIDPLARRA